jgi:hypothetical protein
MLHSSTTEPLIHAQRPVLATRAAVAAAMRSYRLDDGIAMDIQCCTACLHMDSVIVLKSRVISCYNVIHVVLKRA